MVKVSIIIPVYNVEKYLEECLESVINQTLNEIEIICVNDCSTDCSIDILNKYKAIDSRITVIENSKNSGLSYSRNRGIEVSNGEYIYFLDSDDMITVDAMEELYATAICQDLDVVFFDTLLMFETESLKQRFIGYKSERKKEYAGIFVGQDMFVEFIQNRDWMSSVPRQFWKRKYLLDNNLKFYEGIIHEDELFAFLALLQAKRVACLNKKYFIRRFREKSIMTSTISKKNLEGVFICYCEMLSFWYTSDFNEHVNKAINTHLSGFYKRAKVIYKEICGMDKIQELNEGNSITNHLFKLFVSNVQEGRICTQIEKNKMEIIKEYKNVIIYGAGVVARDVLEILDRNEVGIFGFAVSNIISNRKYIMGTKVYCIDELIDYRNDAIVLISVIPKHHKSILEKLEELSFKNVMLML